mmetsp:Transcript_5201/g.8808  ORF Transcript_5201/g.8808 Transcript_5201/m.8808 type:complete len:132 (-) Transcript_5201:311-706(-)
MDELSEKVERIFTILKFLLMAPFILVTSVPIDMAIYFYNLYTKPLDKEEEDGESKISRKILEIFQECCSSALKQNRKAGKGSSTKVNFVKLNKMLQQRLKIQDQIFKLIYDNEDENKFVVDPLTKSKRLHP